jgi:hypothetical protein
MTSRRRRKVFGLLRATIVSLCQVHSYWKNAGRVQLLMKTIKNKNQYDIQLGNLRAPILIWLSFLRSSKNTMLAHSHNNSI